MSQTIRRIVLSVLLVAFAAAPAIVMTGCQTVKGVGKDIQDVGEAGERAIED
ncbi:MAG: entericidin A/B family lipoprotein [Phycisphaerales bacterium JB037]